MTEKEREKATRLFDDPQAAAWDAPVVNIDLPNDDPSRPEDADVLRMIRYFLVFFSGLLIGIGNNITALVGFFMLLGVVFWMARREEM